MQLNSEREIPALYARYLYTRYPIVARALGLAAVQPLGRVRRASKGILHTSKIPLLARAPLGQARARR